MVNKNLGQSLVLALFVVVIAGCQDPTSIGSELLNDVDDLNLEFTDTISIESSTIRDDSIFTVLQSSYLTGSINDPVFDKTYGGIYLQPQLPASNINIGEGLVLDSVVLKLRYPDVYGDKSLLPSFYVYRVQERFYRPPVAIYRNSRSFTIDPNPIGYEPNVKLNPSDSSYLNITLNRSFGEEMISQSGKENFSSTEKFLNYLSGLYLVPDTSQGYGRNMVRINMNNNLTGMYLHYHAPGRDSLLTIFPITGNSAITNYYTHKYSNPDIVGQLNGNTMNMEQTYVQGMAGLATKVEFPGFKELGEVTINKAELVMNVLPSEEDTTFTPPETILPRLRTDTAGIFYRELEDAAFAETFPFYNLGGDREEVTIDGQTYYQYRINLARYFQGVARGTTALEPIYLKAAPAASTPGRAVIAGPKHPNEKLRMRLRLFYTRK